jgi:hypothetical protein
MACADESGDKAKKREKTLLINIIQFAKANLVCYVQ